MMAHPPSPLRCWSVCYMLQSIVTEPVDSGSFGSACKVLHHPAGLFLLLRRISLREMKKEIQSPFYILR